MSVRLRRRRYLASVGSVGVVALSGCLGDGRGGGGNTTVDMTDGLAFEPATLSVRVGDTVTWRNVGSVGHTVSAYESGVPAGAAYFASGGFDAEDVARRAYPDGAVAGGGSYAHTFEAAGTYEYFCIPHERSGMTGTVEVGE